MWACHAPLQPLSFIKSEPEVESVYPLIYAILYYNLKWNNTSVIFAIWTRRAKKNYSFSGATATNKHWHAHRQHKLRLNWHYGAQTMIFGLFCLSRRRIYTRLVPLDRSRKSKIQMCHRESSPGGATSTTSEKPRNLRFWGPVLKFVRERWKRQPMGDSSTNFVQAHVFFSLLNFPERRRNYAGTELGSKN